MCAGLDAPLRILNKVQRILQWCYHHIKAQADVPHRSRVTPELITALHMGHAVSPARNSRAQVMQVNV